MQYWLCGHTVLCGCSNLTVSSLGFTPIRTMLTAVHACEQWKLKLNDLYQQGFVLVWDDTVATSVPWYTADWACVMNIPVWW